MIRFIREGDDIKHGLNLYHPKDFSSIGFKLRIKNTVIVVRWSKLNKNLICKKFIIT